MGDPNPSPRIFRSAPIVKQHLAFEVGVLLVICLLFTSALLDFSPNMLQQTGEHNESSTLFIYFDNSLRGEGKFPLWNPYMQTGIPHSGDPLSQFYNPLILLVSWLFPAITAIKVGVILSFFLLGLGQLAFGYVVGLRLPVRLWSALLVMLSGGMAMLWRLGWIGLVLGFAWVPFSIAFTLLALDTRKRLPIILASASVAMLFLSGSMYWFFYYAGVALFLLVAFVIVYAIKGRYELQDLLPLLKRGALILVIVVGLTAVYLLPFSETLTLMEKHHAPDVNQADSQAVKYALINFFSDDFTFYQSNLFSKAPSGSWMYVGVFPLLLLAVSPLVLQRARYRIPFLILFGLFAFLLAWQASAHNPLGRIYEAIPFLYNFRFSGRLLIVAVIPLALAGGMVLEHLFTESNRLEMSLHLFENRAHQEYRRPQIAVQLSVILNLALVGLLALSIRTVYRANKDFAFAPTEFNAESQRAMEWLDAYDPSIYYIQIGPSSIYWDWLPAAFESGMKVINFNDYGRKLVSLAHQQDPSTPLRALPKYIFVHQDAAPEIPAQLLHSFDSINLYEAESYLPYSFVVDSGLIGGPEPLTSDKVASVDAEFHGPNVIAVNAIVDRRESVLVVLESYYPGWSVYIDGEKASLVQAGDYLGVNALPGDHEYEFRFEPRKLQVGLVISILTLAFCGWYTYRGIQQDR